MVGKASRVVHDAPSATPASSSSDSSYSYDRSDAWHFLYQRNEAHDLYSEATREVRCLEFFLEATQAALSATEGETSTWKCI
jgi:hypothetical protein